MSYRLQTRRPIRAPRSVLFVVITVLLFGTFLFTPLSSGMRFLVHKLGTDAVVSNTLRWFTFKQTLLEENKKLAEENAALTSKAIEHDVLLAENLRLKEITLDDDAIIASVLLHPGFSPFDTFLISKGKVEGLELGDIVLFEAIALGEISEVNEHSSLVTLFSTGNKTFPVQVGVHKLETEARGLGGGSFEVMLPNNAEVVVGDTVLMMSGTPRIFGRVGDIEKEESEAFMRVLFSLPININSIDFVTIEKKRQ